MIKLLTFAEIDTIQWDNLVKCSETATFFQTKDCYDFYKSLSFLNPFIFAVSENNMLVGVMCGYIIAEGNYIKKYFSSRAIVPGGLLLDENISNQALQALLKKSSKKLSRKSIYIEIRNYNDYSSYKDSFEFNGYKYQSHLNFHLTTLDQETVFKNFNTSKRRQIKLSLNAGAIIEEAKNIDDINQFYYILKDLYKTKVRLPLFPIEFFVKLNSIENGKVLIVRLNGNIVGGIAVVMFNKKVVYEWFVCGDENIQKNFYSSVLATYAGIEFSIKSGCQRFDFMGAGKPDEGYGVRDFKSKFGGELVENGRFLHINNPLLYLIGKYFIKKLKKH